SINFRNLAPACHECNSTYKLSKDPMHCAAGRRKAFYPYANPGYSIEVTIDLCKSDIDHLAPPDIQLALGPPALHDALESGKDGSGIEERYKAKCCSASDGKYWLFQVLDEWREDNCSPEDYMSTRRRQTTNNPYADSTFLKKAFLEGCQRAGIFESIAEL